MKKLSHTEFINLCGTKGIDILKITRNFIYIDQENIIDDILPNIHSNLTSIPIRKSWEDIRNSVKVTLASSIKRGQKIEAIIIVRKNTQLGLKDAKDIVCDNWEKWEQLV